MTRAEKRTLEAALKVLERSLRSAEIHLEGLYLQLGKAVHAARSNGAQPQAQEGEQT